MHKENYPIAFLS